MKEVAFLYGDGRQEMRRVGDDLPGNVTVDEWTLAPGEGNLQPGRFTPRYFRRVEVYDGTDLRGAVYVETY